MWRLESGWKMAMWFCLVLLVGACFGSGFVQGLPCESDADCGSQLSCIEGLCGGLGDGALCGNGLRDVGEECDDGNVDDGDDCSATCRLPLEAPTLELRLAPVKQFEFRWKPVLGAECYQLFERADAGSEFVQVGGDREGDSYSITVPLHFRVNASYKLYACNAIRCIASDAVDIVGTLAEAVGYFKASNTDENDRFGSVALSGDGNTLAVGAAGEGSLATGIDGDQGDNSAMDAGAVYVFVRTDKSWSQQAYVKASNTGASDFFGASLALSGDGNTLAVGAAEEDSSATGINGKQGDDLAYGVPYGAGAVYVFARTGQSWSQQAYVKASNTDPEDYFGVSVALSGDGNTMAVGADGEDSHAKGINGDQDNESAPFAGAVYLFVRTGKSWSQQAYVKASNPGENDLFGGSVELSADGKTLAVGAAWESSYATGINGDQGDDLASPAAGAVYVFVRTDDHSWLQHAYVKASNTGAGDHFGSSVALSLDGTTLAVAAGGKDRAVTDIDGAGAVYVFVRFCESWSQQAYVRASNTGAGDHFGSSLALSGDGTILAVGADGEDSNAIGINGDQNDNSAAGTGAVYVFVRTGTAWSKQTYVKASHNINRNFFGYYVSLSDDGTTLAVGAPGENYGTTGIGNQTTIAAFDAGAVYLY